jgi:predicted aspartyl protease
LRAVRDLGKTVSFLVPPALLVALTVLVAPGGRPAGAASSDARLRFERDGHARIPFDMRSQHVWVRGRVNGSDSVWVVIDTGASSSVLDEGLVRDLSLRVVGSHEATGAGGRQTGSVVEDVTIELPGLSVQRRRMHATDLASITPPGTSPMNVILGHELFQSCVVRFDYGSGIVDVWDSGRAPRDLPGASVPVTFENNLPYVEGTLAAPGRAPLRGRFVIDTGSSQALMVNPEVAERESLTNAFPRTLVTMGRGVGGELTSRVGRADSFTLGNLKFVSPTVVVPDPGMGRISAQGSIGNIGGQLLGRCRVTFDYARKRVVFEPGPEFDARFEADMLGATLTRVTGGFTVRWVGADTPALEAGLEIGDLVTHVDGQATEKVDTASLRKRFQREGREVRLRVMRGAVGFERTVTLRRLI